MAAEIAALLALFWGTVQWRAARHEARAEAATPPEGEILDMGGVKVHAVIMGDGPDLVLLHGSGGNTRDMTTSIAPALADRYRVIALDRPGHGYTDRLSRARSSLPAQARLLSETARRLGAHRPLVLGHSFGGGVALAWAVHQPDRLAGLVTVSGPSHPWDTPLDPLYRVNSSLPGSLLAVPLITAFVSDARVERALEEIFAPQPAPPGYAHEIGAGLTLRRASLRANAVQRARVLDDIRALVPHYPRLDMPIEIVHGTADITVGHRIHAERLAQDAPTARLTLLDGIGHMPHHVAPEAVIAAIDRAAARAGLR